ncbi:MAG TPA: glycosyltransferase family 2 protein [bacterium]|nr:glycosyltransferase family 2 protein [bacterium]
MSKPAQKIALPRAAIVVVTYNSAAHIDALAASLRADEPVGYRRELIFVDNASTDDTTARLHTALPEAVVLINEANLGFGAANNRGAAEARARGAEFVAFLNPDTTVEPGWLEPLLHALRADPDLGAVQPLLVDGRDPQQVVSGGNVVTFLGFGYMGGHGRRADRVEAGLRGCAYASGTCLAMRTEEFLACGGFDEPFFLYVEDQDLGWRLRLAGKKAATATAARVRHHYEFHKGAAKFYWLERNRWIFLATHFQARTLALLLPALLIVELGLWAYFLFAGMAAAKARAARDFFRPDIAAWRRAKRATLQRERRLSDRELAAWLTAEIELPGGDPWPVRAVLNPFLRAYWALIKRFI